MTADTLVLSASGLFSKWGFGDGDCVWDWWWDTTDGDLPDGLDDHAVLRQLVRECLLPAITAAGHVVEVYDVDTIHNPIRASAVDGQPFEGVEPDWADAITVAITFEQMHTAALDSGSAR